MACSEGNSFRSKNATLEIQGDHVRKELQESIPETLRPPIKRMALGTEKETDSTNIMETG